MSEQHRSEEEEGGGGVKTNKYRVHYGRGPRSVRFISMRIRGPLMGLNTAHNDGVRFIKLFTFIPSQDAISLVEIMVIGTLQPLGASISKGLVCEQVFCFFGVGGRNLAKFANYQLDSSIRRAAGGGAGGL